MIGDQLVNPIQCLHFAVEIGTCGTHGLTKPCLLSAAAHAHVTIHTHLQAEICIV